MARRIRMLLGAIQSLLHGVDHCFMFPAPDAALLAGGALHLEGASSAVGSPIFADVQALLDRGEAPGRSLAGGAAIDVVIGDIDEVLLAESSTGLGARGQWFGDQPPTIVSCAVASAFRKVRKRKR